MSCENGESMEAILQNLEKENTCNTQRPKKPKGAALPSVKTLLKDAKYEPVLSGMIAEIDKTAAYEVLRGSDTTLDNAWNKTFHAFYDPKKGSGRGLGDMPEGKQAVKHLKDYVVNKLWPAIHQEVSEKSKADKEYLHSLKEYEVRALYQFSMYKKFVKASQDEKKAREELQAKMSAAEMAYGAIPEGAYGTPSSTNLCPETADASDDEKPPADTSHDGGSGDLTEGRFHPFLDMEKILQNALTMLEEKSPDILKRCGASTNNNSEAKKRARLESYQKSYDFWEARHPDKAARYMDKIVELQEELDGMSSSEE